MLLYFHILFLLLVLWYMISNSSTSTHLVKYSTIVMIYFSPVCLALLGNRSMKLISQISKGSDGTIECCSIWCVNSGRLDLWHMSYFSACCQQSRNNICHHNPSCNIFRAVVSPWKWITTPPMCASSMISSLPCSKTHLQITTSLPSLYNCPFASVNGVVLIARIFFFFSDSPLGALPIWKFMFILVSFEGTASTLNKCSYRRSSSILVDSSPNSSWDKWPGLTLLLLGWTMPSNSNSWNNNSHQQMHPWWTILFMMYFSAWWSM